MAVGAYASILSLMHVLDNPHPRVLLNTKKIQTLHEKVHFLQEFFEMYSETNSRDIEDLAMQITEVAKEAEDIIDFHVVDQLCEEYQERIYTGLSSLFSEDTIEGSEVKNDVEISSSFCQDIDKVIEKIDFIEKELLTMVKEQRTRIVVPASSSIFPSHDKNTVVGFDDHLVQIMDQLTSHQPDLQIIPIVGMGGIGKTTLAKTTFDNQYVVNHFDVRVWFTISQKYSMHEILLGVLRNIGVSHDPKTEKLAILQEKLHKHLFNTRYLIVMDDVWSTEAFDHLKLCFPDHGNGSRVIVTTRLTDVAVSLGSYNPYLMDLLDDDKSLNLLCQKAFSQGSCSPELVEIGKEIARSCRGLPLAIVVIGGLLRNSEKTREYWEFIAENVVSYANSENDEHCSRILALSYNHLPIHLKPCFLYMNVFPEDTEIRVSKLIKLWIAEGFVKPLGPKNLEEVGEEHLKDLIDRNLIFIRSEGRTGKMKECSIHDLLRDLCIREYQKEHLCCVPKVQEPVYFKSENGENVCVLCGKRVAKERISVSQVQIDSRSTSLVSPSVCNACGIAYPRRIRLRWVRLHNATSNEERILQHTKLRYLSSHSIHKFVYPSPLPLLWDLQTLIFNSGSEFGKYSIVMPSKIWEMPQLRHVIIENCVLPNPIVNGFEREDLIILENLHTLSTIRNFNWTENILERIPNLKKLKICRDGGKPVDWSCYSLRDLARLHKLESLSLNYSEVKVDKIAFPHSLKKLSLSNCGIPWEDMTSIGSLPNLEVLKLMFGAFVGLEWNPTEGEFRKLKHLSMGRIGSLVQWGAKDTHFPSLETIELYRMYSKIPRCFGDIPTLRLIRMNKCYGVIDSAMEILEDQQSFGNEGFQVHLNHKMITVGDEVRVGQGWASKFFKCRDVNA